MKLFFHLGRYFLLIKRVFSKPEKLSVYMKQIMHEIDNIGISSLPIIAIISFFMGGVITIQSAFGFTSPLVPLYAVGYTVRESMILEWLSRFRRNTFLAQVCHRPTRAQLVIH